MSAPLLLATLAIVTASIGGAVANPSVIDGTPRVVDGDTLDVGGHVVRIHGIDAPEAAQRCPGGPPRLRACGDVAARALTALVNGERTRCEVGGFDGYDRAIATCFVDGVDVGRALVRDGLAMAFVRYSDDYAEDEAQAREANRGLWRTDWQAPWDFRVQRWQSATQQAPKGCPIKGNISQDGDRIYHTPWGSQWYGRTRISPGKGERWFCSEREALDAGWRAPLR
mgnify:CR=1 FL=1